MRTLFITEHAPYPPRTGAALGAWHRIAALQRVGPVDVFSVGERDRDARTLPGVLSWAHVDGRFGEPAVGRPMERLAKFVRPESELAGAEHRLMAFVFQQRPDLIVLSNWLHRFPRALAGSRTPIALDLLEVPVVPPTPEFKGSGSPLRRAVGGLEIRRQEALRRELFAAVGAVWVPEEVQLGRAYALGARAGSVRIVPTGLDPAFYAAVRERTLPLPNGISSGKYVLAHLGCYADQEDEAAALSLLREIVPQLVEDFPNMRLLLIGRGASPKLRSAAAALSGVVLVEDDDPRPYLARATAAVLLRATPDGRHDPLLTAIASGLPVVATPASAAGIAVKDGVHLRMCSSSEAAGAIAALWMERGSAQTLAAAAYDLLVERYGWEASCAAAREMLLSAGEA